MATASDLQQLYVGYFGRAADQAGLNFWLEAINNGGLTLENVHTSFVQSDEYAAQYDGLSNSDLVIQVYLNVLGRAVDAEGLAFWSGALNAGTITQDQLIEGLLSGLSANDALIVANKVTVANYYTDKVGAAYGEADKAASSDILADVDGDLESVSEAIDAVADVVPGGVPNALATALAQAEAAQNAKQAYATALVKAANPADVDATDDIAAVEALYDATVGTKLVADIGAFNAVSTVDIVLGDSATLIAAKIGEATTAAQTAVTTAQNNLNTTVGPALVNSYNAALAKFVAADSAAAGAALNQVGAVAKFEAVNGASITTPAANGTVAGLFDISPTTGSLAVNATWAAANPTKVAAANELLAVVQARVAADAVEKSAQTALLAQADLVEAKNPAATWDADGKQLTGLIVDLAAAKTTQTTLAKEVSDLAETNAIRAEWAKLEKGLTDANKAITDLGYDVVGFDDGDTVGSAGDNEVFIFAETTFGNTANVELDGGDVLFVGTGYSLGVDGAAAGLQGGNNAALEVFFVLNGGTVEAHIETSAFGSSAGTQETNVITLTGVTALDQVSFDAGTGFIALA